MFEKKGSQLGYSFQGDSSKPNSVSFSCNSFGFTFLLNMRAKFTLFAYPFSSPTRFSRHVKLSSAAVNSVVAPPTISCRLSIQPIQWVEEDWTSSTERPTPDFDSHLYVRLLQDCIRNGELRAGKALHCEALKKGNCLDSLAANTLLNFYAKSNLLDDACRLFDEIPDRNIVSFVTLMQGYGRAEKFSEAVELFVRTHREGHELNPFVFTTFLKLLVSMEKAEFGRAIHACIVKLGHDSNAFVGTALIDAYSLCRYVASAKQVFDGIDCKDMVCWTGMITCFTENDCFEDALGLFSQMRMVGYQPNHYTFASVFKACVGLDLVGLGKSLHGSVVKTCHELDLYVGVGLLELYSKFGNMDDAHKVFDELPKKDVIHWSFMISCYSQSFQSMQAVELFQHMRQCSILPNQFTFASVLKACASMESLVLGKQIHSVVLHMGLNSDLFVSNAIMDVYAKCGVIDDSVQIFEDSETKNDVTWNTLIGGYVQLGDTQKALNLFTDMLEHQIQATEVTYSGVLRACASLAAINPGNQIHTLAIKTTYSKTCVVGNSLIDMYAKCGAIDEARLVFDKLSMRDEVTWNTMISGYSMHGLGRESLRVFEMMRESNTRPNKLTFVSVLSACSNSGLLDEGQAYFDSMVKEYDIEPCLEHYTCMVWLLGRSGDLIKAHSLIQTIPFEPSVMVWRALLGACVIHRDVELGRIAAENVLELEPQDEAAYVLLSNIYANARRWGSVAYVRKTMKKKGVKKEPGLSWIEMQGTTHCFTVGDTSHPDMKLISGVLEWLNMKIRNQGYIPNCDAILLQVEDEEKERLLWLHSERLALAFALLRMPSGVPIRIIKNLKICVDCHEVMKFISEVVYRDIIVRDMNRFHQFSNGICSCGDYW